MAAFSIPPRCVKRLPSNRTTSVTSTAFCLLFPMRSAAPTPPPHRMTAPCVWNARPIQHFLPNFESQILPGMNVVILIDRDDRRITRIEGTLFKDVTFGWGFLGRLNRGGRIEITQSKVAGKHWGITRMQLVFDGRIVVVKPLHIEETESSWDYRQVPEMTVAQALQYLRSAPAQPSRDKNKPGVVPGPCIHPVVLTASRPRRACGNTARGCRTPNSNIDVPVVEEGQPPIEIPVCCLYCGTGSPIRIGTRQTTEGGVAIRQPIAIGHREACHLAVAVIGFVGRC